MLYSSYLAKNGGSFESVPKYLMLVWYLNVKMCP